MTTNSALLTRIEQLEKEIAEIKRKLLAESEVIPTLEGIWQDIDVTDEDIEAAKRSLFPDFDDV